MENTKYPAGEILPDNIVGQSFVAHDNYLSGISVDIGTYARIIKTIIVFRLYQIHDINKSISQVISGSNFIFQSLTNSNIIFDNDEYDFYFPLIEKSKGKYYLFTLSSPCSFSGNAITVWVQKTPLHEGVFIESYFHGCSSKHTISCKIRYSPPITPETTPKAILYSPVNQCNLDCIHCLAKDTRKIPARMPKHVKDKIRKLCDNEQIDCIATDYSGDILFSDQKYGGELDYLLRLGVNLTIDSNGQIMNRYIARKLLTSKLRQMNFSLDAGDADTYSSIRHEAIPFHEVIKNIRLFLAVREELDAMHIAVLLSFTLMKRNLHELLQLIDIADDLKVDGIVVRHLEVYTDDMEYESLYHYQDYYNSYRTIIVDYAEEKGVSIWLPRAFDVRPNRTGHRYCLEPWRSAVLLANGDVMACCIPSIFMGSLHRESLEGIWNGVAYQHLRSTVNSENPPDVCKYCPIYRFENNKYSYLFNHVKHEALSSVAKTIGCGVGPS